MKVLKNIKNYRVCNSKKVTSSLKLTKTLDGEDFKVKKLLRKIARYVSNNKKLNKHI